MQPANPCPILLLNLRRSPERLAEAARALGALGLAFERIEAIDGSSLGEAELRRHAPEAPRAFFKTLMPGEVGCALTHRAALARIVEAGWPCALVLEDDAEPDATLPAVLRALVALGPSLPDATNLYGRRPRGLVRALLGPDARLMQSVSPPVGNVAVVWSRRGAQRFLADAAPIRRPVDVDRKHWWERGLDACWISPPTCGEHRALGARSTIGPRRSAGVRARLRKLTYRAEFAIASQLAFARVHGLAAWMRAQRGARR